MGSDARVRRVHWSTAAAIAVALVVAVRTGAWLDAAKTDIKVDLRQDVLVRRACARWTWRPDGKGDVRLAVSSHDDPAAVASRVDPVIIPAVEREMTARGFARAADGADLYVHYYALATVKQSAQIQGQFLPATTEWGLPPFAATTSSLEIYPVGTLLIDVTSAAARADRLARRSAAHHQSRASGRRAPKGAGTGHPGSPPKISAEEVAPRTPAPARARYFGRATSRRTRGRLAPEHRQKCCSIACANRDELVVTARMRPTC